MTAMTDLITMTHLREDRPLPLRYWNRLRNINLCASIAGFFIIVLMQFIILYSMLLLCGAILAYIVSRMVLHFEGRALDLRVSNCLCNISAAEQNRAVDVPRRIQVWADGETLLAIQNRTLTSGDPEFFPLRRYFPTWHALSMLWSPMVMNAAFLENNLLPLGYGKPCVWFILGLVMAVEIVRLVTGKVNVSRCYRVLPGRVDEMVATAFARAPKTLHRIQLQGSSIRCDTHAMTMLISKDGSPGESCIDLRQVVNPIDFVCSVITNATCNRPSPTIPDDQFLG